MTAPASLPLTLSTVLVALAACARPPAGPPDEASVRAVVERLDAACNARDFATYAEHFDSERFVSCEPHLRQIAELLRPERSFVRRTEVVHLSTRGSAAVARVRTTYDVGGRAVTPPTWDGYLVFAPGPDGPHVQIAAELNPTQEGHLDNPEFVCPACNYKVAAVRSWLVVPVPATRTGCMENVAFYNLAADVRAMVSVWGGGVRPSAADALGEMLRARGVEATVQPWTPHAYERQMPLGLSGARASFVRDRRHTSLHLALLDDLHYLVSIDGRAEACSDFAAEIKALVDSFALLDHDRGAKATMDAAARAHLGVAVDPDNAFVHRATAVGFRGPPNWQARLLHGPHVFKVAFLCPSERGSIWATALRVSGDLEQRRRAADAIVERSLRDAGIEPSAASEWEAWDDAPRPGSLRRRVRCAPTTAAEAERTRERALHAVLTDSLLIVFEWQLTADAVADAEKVLTTLKW